MATQNVPEFQPHVKLDATVGVAPYVESLDNMALSPTALGQLGTKIAVSASNAFQQQRGYNAGLNPHGSILPPITQADKAYTDAYVTQSQNTLGIQATKLLMDGQEQINKSWKINPGMITTYKQNMQQGLQDIIKNAPIQAMGSLSTQFSSQLLSSTHNLNDKMIAQQKSQALQNASLNNTNQLSAIYDAGRSGQTDVAKRLSDDMIARNDKMVASGMYSPVQAETAKKAAQNSLLTGVYGGEAVKAFNEKRADQYLSDLFKNKPAGVNYQEWDHVLTNVIGEVQLAESTQQRNETALYSEGTRLLNEGTLSSDFIHQLESQTTSKPMFNNFMAKVATYNRKVGLNKQTADSALKGWTNSDAMALSNDKSKDAALILAANAQKNLAAVSGRQLDDFQAQTEAMATAATPVSAYTKIMNSGLLSGNANLMLRNAEAYKMLQNSNAKALLNVSPKAEAMLTNFNQQIEDGNNPDVAAQKAYAIVQQKTKEQRDANLEIYNDWKNSNVNTVSKLNSWASQFADIGKGAAINNLPAFAQKTLQIFKDNMQYLNGDVQGASEMTLNGMKKSWGVTEINGQKEFVFQPLEKTLGLHSDAKPLILQDAYQQIQKQIEPMAILYDESIKNNDHRVTFKYELEPRPSLEEFIAAKKFINNFQGKEEPTSEGMIQKGNIDLFNRPQVKNKDGSISTVRSISVNFDNKEVLIPTVSDDGRILSNDEAIQLYKKTGKQLGIFSSPEAATKYAKELHKQQENYYLKSSNSSNSNQLEKLNQAADTISRFKNEPLKIKRINADKTTQEFTIAIQANPGLQQDNNGNIGSYNVSMRTNNGPSVPMNGFFNGPLSEPVYKPNTKAINDLYAKFVGINYPNLSAKEIYENWIRHNPTEKEVPQLSEALRKGI